MVDAVELVDIFNSLFVEDCRTELVSGGEEPIYLPATNNEELHRIIFTRDYFSSALHEISHWCIAGSERRKLVDFGYWYEPDGRTLQQQLAFEVVEVKPQALEWVFSAAAGIKFCVSVDNLNICEYDSSGFTGLVRQQVTRYLTEGLSDRAHRFTQGLVNYYQPDTSFEAFSRYLLEQLEGDLEAELPIAQSKLAFSVSGSSVT